MGIARAIRLLQSDKVSVPFTWGIIKPCIVIPSEAGLWSSRKLEIVLLHECAHIKRMDILGNVIANISTALYWFHPLLWITLHKFYDERERACDEHVLGAGIKPSEYAYYLLEFARNLCNSRVLLSTGVGMARMINLEERIMAILNHRHRKKVRLWMSVCIILFAASLLVPLAGLRTYAAFNDLQSQSTAEEERIKGILGDFYRALDDMDFSRAIQFFTSPGSEYEFETLSIPILEKRRSGETFSIALVAKKKWQSLNVGYSIKSITPEADGYLAKVELDISGSTIENEIFLSR